MGFHVYHKVSIVGPFHQSPAAAARVDIDLHGAGALDAAGQTLDALHGVLHHGLAAVKNDEERMGHGKRRLEDLQGKRYFNEVQ